MYLNLSVLPQIFVGRIQLEDIIFRKVWGTLSITENLHNEQVFDPPNHTEALAQL